MSVRKHRKSTRDDQCSPLDSLVLDASIAQARQMRENSFTAHRRFSLGPTQYSESCPFLQACAIGSEADPGC